MKNLLGPNENKSTDKHASSNANICNNGFLNILILIDVIKKLGSNMRWRHMLFKVYLLFLPKLKIFHI